MYCNLKISVINCQLETTVYSKPIDSHLYLHAKSCHKASSIRDIQKGVALRLRRICSTGNKYSSKSVEYQDYLSCRGHDPKIVHDTFAEISKVTRNDARKKTVNNNSNNNRVIFSTKFNPRGPNVTKIIKENFHLLQNNEILKKLFPENSILLANKRENNLKDLSLRSDPYNIKTDLLDNTKHGYKSCKEKCDSCINFVHETTAIKFFVATERIFKMRRDRSCQTKNVICIAYCLPLETTLGKL